MNQVLTSVLRWLLISILFAAPIAIAKHQFDHYDTAQSIDQCKLCAHVQPFDDGPPTTANLHALNIIKLGQQANELTTDLQQKQVNHFLTRAPPK